MTFLLPWTLALMAAPLPVKIDTTQVARLAERALAGDASAVTSLRDLGQPGLDVLRRVRAELSSLPPSVAALPRAFALPGTKPAPDPRATAWDALVDKVARQQYATLSGLYWYTDLEDATAEATRSGKPILSLRLLGDLDEVLSCANSRFFRTLLYPDPAVRAALHDRFVLHWETVHKAPKITIDFGDGRVLTRTVTGNSLHYLLDAKGRVIDALPGLHGPAAFVAWLDAVSPFAKAHLADADDVFADALRAQHRAWKAERLTRWQGALASLGMKLRPDHGELAAATTEAVIDQLAASRRDALRVDPQVASFLANEFPTANEVAPLAITKMAVERPMLPWLRNLQGTLARDEVQNDFPMHALIHDLFDIQGMNTQGLTALIYARVFQTPLNDPYMGLAPPDVFTAIPPDLEKKGDALGAVDRALDPSLGPAIR